MKLIKSISSTIIIGASTISSAQAEKRYLNADPVQRPAGLNIRIFNKTTQSYETLNGLYENMTLKELKERVRLNSDENIIIDSDLDGIYSEPRNIQTIEIY